MSPVHQAAEIVPLVHAPKANPVAHSQRHALREIDIVCDKQGLAPGQLEDEALVTGIIVIVRQ